MGKSNPTTPKRNKKSHHHKSEKQSPVTSSNIQQSLAQFNIQSNSPQSPATNLQSSTQPVPNKSAIDIDNEPQSSPTKLIHSRIRFPELQQISLAEYSAMVVDNPEGFHVLKYFTIDNVAISQKSLDELDKELSTYSGCVTCKRRIQTSECNTCHTTDAKTFWKMMLHFQQGDTQLSIIAFDEVMVQLLGSTAEEVLSLKETDEELYSANILIPLAIKLSNTRYKILVRLASRTLYNGQTVLSTSVHKIYQRPN